MRLIIALHLGIGILLMAVGFAATARPYLLLDVVLTEEQLRNEELHDSTLALLQRGAGSDSAWMIGCGAILAVTSLFARFRRPPPS